MRARFDRMQTCYERALAEHPTLRGRAMVRFARIDTKMLRTVLVEAWLGRAPKRHGGP